jgi:beta-glucosidase
MRTKPSILFFIAMSILSSNIKAQKLPQLGKDPVSRVVAAMTLEEKTSIVAGTGIRIPGLPANMIPGSNDAGVKDLVPGAAGSTFAIPRLGIPSVIVADGPAGLRISPTRDGEKETYYCTAFPIATLLASTWDKELVSRVGEAMGNEVLEYGVDILLAPGLNIHRNPLGGRDFEYFSEDPVVTGEMAAAIIKGIQSQGVGTAPKHFAANNAETNRTSLNTIVSERALREIYLKGFRTAVINANPWTVMSAYNLINDIYAPENHDLLTTVLRKDWGFKGFVMTDWFGGKDPLAMMKAGNDLLMPGMANQSKLILDAVNNGSLSEEVLDRNVTRILNIIVQSPKFKGYRYSNKPDLEAHARTAREAGADGMILLKNNGSALPFPGEVKKIALFGISSYNTISGGTGSGDVNEAYTVSIAEGLRNAGYNVNDNLSRLYEIYLQNIRIGRPVPTGIMALMPQEPIEELPVNRDIIRGSAATNEAAVITIGRISGEGRDRQNVKGDFQLTDSEFQMIRQVSEIFRERGRKVIVILNTGGVIETDSWKEFPDAILCSWQAGQEAGNSVADILGGKTTPSGKLATTFPIAYEDVPSSKTFPGMETVESKPPADSPLDAFMSSVPSLVYYEDGIYVGYRYYESFDVKTSFEFGFGLSYTKFEYSNIRLNSPRGSKTLLITVDIRNSGKVAGKEAVQLYISAPGGKLDKPSMELKEFAKTGLLQPGETQTLNFTIDNADLASFDPLSSSWIAAAGNYEIRIGASSRDIRQTARFTLDRDVVVQKVSRALVPKDKIKEIRP